MSRKISAVLGILIALLCLPQPVSAHEKWFVDRPNDYALEWGLLGSWPVVVAVAIAFAALALACALESRLCARQHVRGGNVLAGIGEERLRRVYAYCRSCSRFTWRCRSWSMGSVCNCSRRIYTMRTNLLSGVLALAEVLIALALVYGVFTDYAAFGLVGLFIAGLVFGPLVGIPPLFLSEHVDFVGIAVFVYIIGRGPFSADALLGRRAHPHPALIPYAIPALRWGVGLSFVFLAFSEKFLNPALADAFLAQKINFNVGAGFGLPNGLFVYGAAIAELTFGQLLNSGMVPRLVIVALWIPANLTLPYLGWVELAGHLPIYGVLLTLLIVGASDQPTVRQSMRILTEEADVLATREPVGTR